MNIQINTGHNIHGNEDLIANFSSIIENSLSRVSDHITSVEVHMKDEDGVKKGKNDKRCMIEARLEGRQPIVVTDHSDTLNQALDNAIDKLINMIESILGRQHDKRNRDSKQSTTDLN
jgi:ribosome-associated translation inhibitor RaiA